MHIVRFVTSARPASPQNINIGLPPGADVPAILAFTRQMVEVEDAALADFATAFAAAARLAYGRQVMLLPSGSWEATAVRMDLDGHVWTVAAMASGHIRVFHEAFDLDDDDAIQTSDAWNAPLKHVEDPATHRRPLTAFVLVAA